MELTKSVVQTMFIIPIFLVLLHTMSD